MISNKPGSSGASSSFCCGAATWVLLPGVVTASVDSGSAAAISPNVPAVMWTGVDPAVSSGGERACALAPRLPGQAGGATLAREAGQVVVLAAMVRWHGTQSHLRREAGQVIFADAVVEGWAGRALDLAPLGDRDLAARTEQARGLAQQRRDVVGFVQDERDQHAVGGGI